MAQSKKYDYRVLTQNSSWTAEIIRRVTSKKTIVSKSQGNFATESEADQWGKKELESFLKNLKDSNQRHSNQRQEKAFRIKSKAEANAKTEPN